MGRILVRSLGLGIALLSFLSLPVLAQDDDLRREMVDSPDALDRLTALHELAASGDNDARFALAWAYRTGSFIYDRADARTDGDSPPPLRISPDGARALGWMILAANAGHPQAHALISSFARSREMDWRPTPLKVQPMPHEPPEKQAGPVAGPGGWMVQVGLFSDEANADRLVEALKDQGWSDVDKHQMPENKLHMVAVGPIRKKQEAQAALGTISEMNDLEPLLVRARPTTE